VLTGFLTITFFGGTLMLQALFSKAEVPEGVVYYRQEVIVTPQRIAGREVFAHLPEEPPELREEAAAREALSAKRRG